MKMATNNVEKKVVEMQQEQVKAEDLRVLDRLKNNVKGQSDLENKLKESEPNIKSLLKGIDEQKWKALYKKATPEDQKELVLLFRYLNFNIDKLNFSDEEEKIKEEIRKELSLLNSVILETSKNEYKNLDNDNYGTDAKGKLDVTKDDRDQEDLAIANFLLSEKPNKEASDIFNSLVRKNKASWVLQTMIEKGIKEGSFTTEDIFNNTDIARYYENDASALRNDIGRIAYLFNAHNEDISKLLAQEDMLNFVSKIKDWNTMTNVLAYILSKDEYADKFKNGDVNGSFTKKDINSDPQIKEYYGKGRFLVNETSRILKLLNNISKENAQKILDIKGNSKANIKEAYNAQKHIEANEQILNENPFLLVSDINLNGVSDRGEAGIANNHRWSEQQLYATFLSNADTKNYIYKKEDTSRKILANMVSNLNISGVDTSSSSMKKIIDGPRTADIIAGFKTLLRGTNYPVDEIKNNKLSEFSSFLRKYPEAIAIYRKELDKRSYNSSIDLNDLITERGQKKLLEKDNLQAVKELNAIRDETRTWFEETLNGLPENDPAREWYNSLDARGKVSTLRKIIDTVDKVPNALLSLAGISVTESAKIKNKSDLLKTMKWSVNFLKDDAGIGPRFTLGFDHEKVKTVFQHSDGSQIGDPIIESIIKFNPRIDIPIVNLSGEKDINQQEIMDGNMNVVEGVDKVYGRLGANIHAYLKNPETGKIDTNLSGRFSALLEGALGWKRSYKEGIELKSSRLGELLTKAFENTNFSSKDAFLSNTKKKIEDLKKDKNFSTYLTNNPEFSLYLVDSIASSLEQVGIFDPRNHNKDNFQKNSEYLLNSFLRGVVEEMKNENMEQLNGKTKLTRLGIFAQIGAFLGGKNTVEGTNGETITYKKGPFYSLGIETSISSWMMLYGPDQEKFKYMDESLKSGESLQKEPLKTDTPDNIVNSIKHLLDKTNIVGFSIGMNDNNQIEITIPDAVLKKYGKGNARELLNIYVKPDKEKDVATEKNKITLGKIDNLSVVTRNYFDDFAVYLFLGGNGVRDCGPDSLVKGEKKSDAISSFEFIEEKEASSETKELEFGYNGFKFENELKKEVFDVIQYVDNQKYNRALGAQFLSQMNRGKINEASKTVSTMFKNYVSHQKWAKDFSKIGEYLEDSNTDINAKIQTLNTLKALFAFTNVHNELGLDINLKQRKEVFAGLDKDFPLDKEIAVKIRNDLITKVKTNNPEGEYSFNSEPSIVGYTAFYSKSHKNDENNKPRGYSLNALGNNNIFGGEMVSLTEDKQKTATKEWLKKKMESDSLGYKEILSQVKNNLDASGIKYTNDEEIKNLLWSDEAIDIGGKKIKIEKDYIFYLLGECANESLGMKLGNLVIEGEKVEGSGNQINLYSDTQVLEKTSYLDEKQINGKRSFVSLTTQETNVKKDNGYGGNTNQEGGTGTGTDNDNGNSGSSDQNSGTGSGSGEGGENNGEGSGSR